MTVPRIQTLLNEMESHRIKFEAFCRSLSEEELARQVPDSPWTVFDYIAHLATIESLINPWFGAMVSVKDIPRADVKPPQPFDLDDWNEAIVATRHERSLDDVLAEAAENRARYTGLLEKMTDDQLDAKVPFGGDRKKIDLPPVLVQFHSILSGIAMHDATHVRDMLRALPERAGDPDLRAWLRDLDLSRVSPEMAARRA